jgi:hypothetical protein
MQAAALGATHPDFMLPEVEQDLVVIRQLELERGTRCGASDHRLQGSAPCIQRRPDNAQLRRRFRLAASWHCRRAPRPESVLRRSPPDPTMAPAGFVLRLPGEAQFELDGQRA